MKFNQNSVYLTESIFAMKTRVTSDQSDSTSHVKYLSLIYILIVNPVIVTVTFSNTCNSDIV